MIIERRGLEAGREEEIQKEKDAVGMEGVRHGGGEAEGREAGAGRHGRREGGMGQGGSEAGSWK